MKPLLASALASLTLLSPIQAFDPPSVGVHPAIEANYQSFFPAGVFTVTEGVYVARGYNRNNPTLIEGNNGLIIIDPGESIPGAQAAKNAFSQHLGNIFDRKPVKAIIYTHYHDCHINGASVFADRHTEIIAHESLMPVLFDEWFSQLYPNRIENGGKMSGALFQHDPGWFAGGILYGIQRLGPSGFMPPTRTVKDELKTTIAGVELNLISAPGETRDVIIIWLPGKKTLIEIGILYESFPALTTMRGSGPRNPMDYLASLKRCRSLEAEHLVALHGPHPITNGKENVRQFLTDFSDAIQYMHDQTVQLMNRGFTPGEIMDLMTWPPHLAARPYLQQTYGRLDWNIYHIFRYYRGYYTGQVRDLFPQSPLSQAQMAVELAGGVSALAAKAEQLRSAGKLEWALELADDVLILDPEHEQAFATKMACMLSLAEQTDNAQARNMLLSDYLLLTGQSGTTFPYGQPKRIFARMDEGAVRLMPMETLHRIMAVSLNASQSLETESSVTLQLSDVRKNNRTEKASHTLQVRRGVFEANPPGPVQSQFGIITDSLTWKHLVLGKLSPADAIANGTVSLSGASPGSFFAFMQLFE